MKKNIIPLVIIALVVAVLSTGVFYGLIAGRMDGSPSASTRVGVVANRGLDAGRALQAEDLRLTQIPDPGAPFLGRLEDAVGRRVKQKIEAGKPILEANLGPAEEKISGGGIPEGMRAITIHISDSTGVMRLLKGGDRIDVQSILPRQRQGENDIEVRTILQNAVVYQVVAETPNNNASRQALTILSSPQDAERLAAADTGARLRVILRNQKDHQIVSLPSANLLNLSAARPLVQSNFHPGAIVKPAELEVSVWEVEYAALDGILSTDSLQVSRSGLKFEELQKAKRAHLLTSSRLVAGRSGEFSWKAGESALMKVRIEPLGASQGELRIKVQPESTFSGATRRVESTIQIGLQQSALVSGWATPAKTEGRTVLVSIAPVGRK